VQFKAQCSAHVGGFDGGKSSRCCLLKSRGPFEPGKTYRITIEEEGETPWEPS
jgi:hypothetical protein